MLLNTENFETKRIRKSILKYNMSKINEEKVQR